MRRACTAPLSLQRNLGIRFEEALELTHLCTRQYQRPAGEIIALLLIAPSTSDRERVIPMSAELFSVIAAIIRRHTQDGQAIPPLSRYGPTNAKPARRWRSWFNARLGRPRGHLLATVVNMLRRRCEELAERHPGFRIACFTPHDFRRLCETDLVNNGLPFHIGAALLGHYAVALDSAA